MTISSEFNEIVTKIYNATGNDYLYNHMLDIMHNHKDMEREIDFIGIAKEDPGKISYLNKAKIERAIKEGNLEEKKWDPKYRIMANPGKVIKIICPEIGDVAVQEFNEFFKLKCRVYCGACEEITIVKGEDIRKYYHEDNYSGNCYDNGGDSPLWCSCMRHDECQPYLDLYVKNSQVSMAVMLDGEYVRSRALIWHGDEDYYDRIYSINQDTTAIMQSCLEAKGFTNISFSNPIKPKTQSIEIKLDYGQHELTHFPYCDTMSYLNGKMISNDCNGDYVELNDAEGGHSGTRREYCFSCDEPMDEDDICLIETGPNVGYNFCSECSVYSDVEGGSIDRDYATNTDHDGWILTRNRRVLHDGTDCHEDNSVELYNGKYAHESEDLIEDVEDEKFVSGDDNFVMIGEEYYHINHEDIEIGDDGQYKIKEYA